jgi:hypothetical protein
MTTTTRPTYASPREEFIPGTARVVWLDTHVGVGLIGRTVTTVTDDGVLSRESTIRVCVDIPVTYVTEAAILLPGALHEVAEAIEDEGGPRP